MNKSFNITAWGPGGEGTVTLLGPVHPGSLFHEEYVDGEEEYVDGEHEKSSSEEKFLEEKSE